MDDKLMHIGTPRHSGRYPWGSGKQPYQRNKDFLASVKEMQAKGMSQAEIAKGLGLRSSKELREQMSIASNKKKLADTHMAQRLKDKGYSTVAIGRRMGVNESTVRSWLNPARQEKAKITQATVNVLKKEVAEKRFLDVGDGTERWMGISRTKLDTALRDMENQGYKVMFVNVKQLGTGKTTSLRVLCPPGTDYKNDLIANKEKIRFLTDYSEDGGRSWLGLEKPASLSSSRIKVRYADDDSSGTTGAELDGTIELRRGVSDISLGKNRYAQVRIAVDDTHYLKGMAVYSDNIPDGYDVVFNTNKKKDTPKMKVFKKMKEDPDNPFGATIKREEQLKRAQRWYTDQDGNKQLSKINIVNEEGDWTKWKKAISSQMLSKQRPAIAKTQLEKALDIRKKEYDEILLLTNPVIKKKLLTSFAETLDKDAMNLKGAAFPRQGYKVILPIPSLKDDEIFAPGFREGESVVLIRFPHGGKFEIPTLKVNNKNKDALSIIGSRAEDAVGINSKVAQVLSGADFDGDTVLVIPNKSGAIQAAPPLLGLKDFDPQTAYPKRKGMKRMGAKDTDEDVIDGTYKIGGQTNQEMGNISNLITDMTIKGADASELARAVRHSMVIIDAEKHVLDYETSKTENRIAELKRAYQGGANKGAATIVSQAKARAYVPERTDYYKIDPATGKKVWGTTGRTYTDAKGNLVEAQTRTRKMDTVEDARDLMSGPNHEGTRIEIVYADYANKVKAFANTTRKEILKQPTIEKNKEAFEKYQTEVASLEAKLKLARMNAPLERQAQILGNAKVDAMKAANPSMEKDDLKKYKNQALQEARARVREGAVKDGIDLTVSPRQFYIEDREWEAIQAGAFTNSKLTAILNEADEDRVKELATPRSANLMTTSQISKAKQRLNAGRTQAEVADSLGVSVATLNKAIAE